jgi:hypothetical protein
LEQNTWSCFEHSASYTKKARLGKLKPVAVKISSDEDIVMPEQLESLSADARVTTEILGASSQPKELSHCYSVSHS